MHDPYDIHAGDQVTYCRFGKGRKTEKVRGKVQQVKDDGAFVVLSDNTAGQWISLIFLTKEA